MSEASIARASNKRLDKRGAYSFPTTGVAIAGIADRAACYRGQYLAVEYKQPGQNPRPNQQRHLELVRRAGGHAIVATHPDDIDRALDQIDELLDRPTEETSARP